MVNREIISEIRNNLNAVNPDVWLPGAYIYSKLKGFAALFIKREADDKRLFRFSDLFTTIKCLSMEEKDLVDCCDIRIPNCKTVMRSKSPLPELFTTRYGYLLTVSSVDFDKDYIPTTPKQFQYTQSREFNDPRSRYFWLENGYLITPVLNGVTPVRLTVKGMFTNKAEALRLDECSSQETACIRLMDEDFVAPEHLLQEIKDATTKDLLGSYKQIQPDELTNKNSLEKTNPEK